MKASGLFRVLAVAALAATHVASRGDPKCREARMTVLNCLPALLSSSVDPNESCCDGESDLNDDSHCLYCVTVPAAEGYPRTFNMAKAITLPGRCNVTRPSFPYCDILAPPSGSAVAVASCVLMAVVALLHLVAFF